MLILKKKKKSIHNNLNTLNKNLRLYMKIPNKTCILIFNVHFNVLTKIPVSKKKKKNHIFHSIIKKHK
jgi:hypothetical protein